MERCYSALVHLKSGIGIRSTSIDTAIPTIERACLRAGDTLRLAILYTATEAVQVTLANEYVLIGLLELENDAMHPVDCSLESFKVRGNRDNVLVQSANLELMILKVSRYVLFVRLRIDVFLELCHIEIVSDCDHSLVPANEFILKL